MIFSAFLVLSKKQKPFEEITRERGRQEERERDIDERETESFQ